MRIPRIFTDLTLSCDSSLILDGSAARHLSSALRMKVGQAITLFNGQGGEYAGELTAVGKSKVSVKVTEYCDINRESALKLHLAIGVSRGERMDLIVQKATELGVAEITPLFTERTEVKLSGERLDKKIRHWQQVAISACEQCQRNLVPVINSPATLDQWLNLGNQIQMSTLGTRIGVRNLPFRPPFPQPTFLASIYHKHVCLQIKNQQEQF